MTRFDFFVLGQMAEKPVRVSYLTWAMRALGPFYAFVLPMTGLLVFIGAVVVVIACRRPSVIAAYLVFLPLPLLIGAYGTVQGMIASYSVMATSAAAPQPAQLAEGYSTALFTALLGLLLTFPSYFVLSCGLFIRTILWREGTEKLR